MAEPNFTLSNAAFALSPMVLRAITNPGRSMTLTVSEPVTGKRIQVTVTADVDGVAVYDVSPLVRAFLSGQFLRDNIVPDAWSPYGSTLDIRITDTYGVYGRCLWARAETSLVRATGIAVGTFNTVWLLPTGRYVYRKGAPAGMITTVSEDVDNPLYARDKRTGSVTELSPDFYPFDGVYSHGDGLFAALPAGEYRVYMGNDRAGGFDLTVEDCFPTDAIEDGTMAYVRYCNRWGGISYALLKVRQRSVNSKNTYVRKAYALDDAVDGDYYHVSPDRVMTGQDITPSFKAGKDMLTRSELEDLQSIAVSPMVDMYDAGKGGWVPVYPSDATVTESNEALQEITFDFNLNTEGF